MIIYIPFFLCWGSFLNVLAYRLICGKSVIKPRSFCPHCTTIIAWYDNIPVLSWILLQGKCRTCAQSISVLYPFIETVTTLLLVCLYIFIPHYYFLPYFIFISALIVTIRSDIETMLISSYMTLYLVPLALAFSWFSWLPISFGESVAGALIGYFCLYIVNGIFKYFKGHDGIGEGDFELLCLIGAFTGLVGCWATVTIGSALGCLYGITCLTYDYFCFHDDDSKAIYSQKIPFGPFLAIGSIIFIFVQSQYDLILFFK